MSNTEDRKDAQVYELGYLLLPSLTDESLSSAVNAIKGIIKKAGASELDSENPLGIDLAYTMSKSIGARKYVVNEAYIGWVKFEGEPNCVAEINEALKALDEVLRFLVVKAPKETTFTFAAAIKAKEDKEREKQEAMMANIVEAGDKPEGESVLPVVE